MINPSSIASTWDTERADARADMCVGFLYVHGFMTEAERDAVKRRIKKWREKGGA